MIVVFGGHYHGHLDDTLVDGRRGTARGRAARPEPARGGRHPARPVQRRWTRSSASSPREDVAAVITEPALTNVGVVLPETASTRACARLTRAHGTLLVLDETHTQTVAYGG